MIEQVERLGAELKARLPGDGEITLQREIGLLEAGTVHPFHGFAYLGYIPHERIIGISKLTRLVRLFARRFTVQEFMGRSIADSLFDLMAPHGVAVYLEAEHLCTQMRGVREEHSRTVTTFWRGAYEESPDLRREFLQLAQNGDRKR